MNSDAPLPLSDNVILTVKELAEHLRIHSSTAYRLVKAGAIPHFRLGGSIRFSMKAIKRWEERKQ